MWTVSWAWAYVTQFNTVAQESQRQTERQGFIRSHCRLGTSHHWTRSQYIVSNNHSQHREHKNEQSGHTFRIAQFYRCLFMVHFMTLLGTSHSIVSNGTVTHKWWTAEDLEGNNREIIQVLSQYVSGRTKEKHENQPGLQLYWTRFEMGI